MQVKSGTIRAREAGQIVRDLLVSNGVPAGVYRVAANKLPLLVDGRVVEFDIGRGHTYYSLRDTISRVERAIVEMRATRDKRQIDIEEVIARGTA